MKIFFCLHHFLPEFIGGTEVYTFNLAKAFVQRDFNVVIVIPNFGVDKTEEYYYEGIRVIKYAENSVEDRAMIKGFKTPSGLKAFSDSLKSEHPDIVHFQELAPGRGINISHVEEAHRLNFRVFISFHLAQHTCIKGSLIYMDTEKCDGETRITKCSECLYHNRGLTGAKRTIINKVAVTLYNLHLNIYKMDNSIGTALGFPFMVDRLKNDLVKLSAFSEKMIVLTKWYKKVLQLNGVPPDKISYVQQALAHPEMNIGEPPGIAVLPLKIIFVGRISKLKGIHLLIDAVMGLDPGKVALSIYGPETESEFAMELKKKTVSEKNIYWKGLLEFEKVIPAIRMHDLLCLPSTFSEMSPLVIQEAFAAHTPVLASDVYGNSEQVKEGENGWLFPYNDMTGLKNKIAHLINHPELIEKAKNHPFLPRTFEQVANEHIALYIQHSSPAKSSVVSL